MAAELGSIATKAIEKKSGKSVGLNALLKLGALDEKAFSDKLSKALDHTDKKSLKPIILELKKELKNEKADQKNQTSKKDTKHDQKSIDEAREFLYKQAMSMAKLSNEVGVEKAVKELRDFAKGNKKLSELLEKIEKAGMKAKISFEQEDESKEAKESKQTKETKKAKKTEETAPKEVAKEVKKEEPKVSTENHTAKALKLDADEKDRKNAVDAANAKNAKDAHELKTKNDADKKAQDAKDAKSTKDVADADARAEHAKVQDKKSDEKVETKPAQAVKNDQPVQKKDDKESEVKEAVKEQKTQKVEALKDETKKELITDNSQLKQLQKDNTPTQAAKVEDKVQTPAKKEEKPLDLMQLLAGLEDMKGKKDESLTSKENKEGKPDSQKDNMQERLMQLQSASNVQNTEDSIGQKVRDAAVTIKNFAEDLKDKMDEYKPPLMKVSMELRPENMPPVDVTMITRGQNLIVNINSGEEALKMFLNNATDFRQNLMDIGFTEMTMNFNFKDQNGEKKQYQFNEQKAKKYQEIEEVSAGITDIEVIVPRYA